MSSFEETLARMKGLYTYGKELNESKDFNSHTLEYHAIAADGKSYGIIKECNKYYIKSAPKDKEMVAESYEYLGGFCNRKNYEYSSYANALKNFEMKMASINEACEGNVNIATLDPFKKEEFLVEGTDRMRSEIARQRQIMYNASMIMNESDKSIKPVIGGEANKAKQPEAENGKKGDEDYKETKANPTYTGSNNGKMGGNGPDKKVGPFNEPVNEGACAKCGQEECKCNEESGDISDEPLMPNTRNWAGPKMGASEPDQIGWDMDGQEKVNEETNEWDEGLPDSAGIGEPDTDHNNDPFNKSTKSLNEEDEDTDEPSEEPTDEPSEDGDDTFDLGGDESGEFGDESGEFGDEGDEFGNEFGDETEEGGEEDLRAEVEALKAEIEALKAQIEGGDTEDLGGGEDFGDGEDFGEESGEFGPDYEFGGEDGEDFSTTDEFDDEESGEIDEIGETPHGQEMLGRVAARQQYRSGQQTGNNGGLGFNGEGGSGDTAKFASGKLGNNSVKNGIMNQAFATGYDKQMRKMGVNEAKKAKMDSIVESVVRDILKEDELHVFGKHPGYRKKPMELPTTGEDQNQWGRDWNDDSVHSEEPFGSKIGDGDPFTQLVNAVTKDVMYQLKKGIPIEGSNKKKVD